MILYGAGALLGLLTIAVFRLAGSRRELGNYASALIIAALIYVVFAVVGGAGGRWIWTELVGLGFYGAFAVLGLKHRRGWLVAVGWGLHVVWDIALHGEETPFVPWWYPAVCLGYDAVVAGYIGWRFRKVHTLEIVT